MSWQIEIKNAGTTDERLFEEVEYCASCWGVFPIDKLERLDDGNKYCDFCALDAKLEFAKELNDDFNG